MKLGNAVKGKATESCSASDQKNASINTPAETQSCNPVCGMLHRAGVPFDLRWRGSINFLRELESDSRYSLEQKKMFHSCLANIIKEKKFSNAKLKEVNHQIESIRHANCIIKEQALKNQLKDRDQLLKKEKKATNSLLATYTEIIQNSLKTFHDNIDDVDKLKDTTIDAIQSDNDKDIIIQKVTNATGKLVDKMVRESAMLKEKAEEAEKWKQRAKAMEYLAMVDQLTQLYNRRAFDEYMNEMIKDIEIREKALSMIFLDIDYFKKFNDSYGHDTGDKVLRIVADIIKKECIRDGDFIARFGGEEIVVVCENLCCENAKDVAERIRKSIENYQFIINGPEMENAQITISAGVAELLPEWIARTDSGYMEVPEESEKLEINRIKTRLFKAADMALYEAKSNGRNCVCVYKQ